MTTRHVAPARMSSAISLIGVQGVTNANSGFSAKDSIALLEAKAADWFVGRSITEIKQALNHAGYRDVMVVELRDAIAPGASLVEEGVALTAEDVHLLVKLESASGFAIGTPRVSFFLRMHHGVCSTVLKARKLTK